MRATRTYTVDADQETVHRFLADFSSTEQWDPGTVTCVRTDDGPLGVGSTWHNVSDYRGRRTELTYRLAEMTADHLRFTGENKTATTVDDLRLAPAGPGRTQITYTGDICFRGLLRLGEPFLRGSFTRLADQTVAQMTAAIAAL